MKMTKCCYQLRGDSVGIRQCYACDTEAHHGILGARASHAYYQQEDEPWCWVIGYLSCILTCTPIVTLSVYADLHAASADGDLAVISPRFDERK